MATWANNCTRAANGTIVYQVSTNMTLKITLFANQPSHVGDGTYFPEGHHKQQQ